MTARRGNYYNSHFTGKGLSGSSLLLALAFLSCSAMASGGHTWGTFKPNLYFAVKEKAKEQNVLGLAWMVKDWRTDQLIVRHAYQYANPAENV